MSLRVAMNVPWAAHPLTPGAPISSSRSCRASRVSLSSGRLANSSMRRLSRSSARRNARRRSASEPVTAAGSGTPQCAVIGCPGQTGHCSAAAWSQTVNTKCMCGASGAVNSSQLLLRRPSVGTRCCSSSSSASGSIRPFGWLPALNARNLRPPIGRMIHHGLGEDRARGISRAQEQHVQHSMASSA